MPRSRTLRRGRIDDDQVSRFSRKENRDFEDYEEEPTTAPKVDDWAVRFREVQVRVTNGSVSNRRRELTNNFYSQERVHENDQLRRRLVQQLEELRKKGEMDRETTKRIQARAWTISID